MKTVHPNVAVLVMTDREGNLLFKHTGENSSEQSDKGRVEAQSIRKQFNMF